MRTLPLPRRGTYRAALGTLLLLLLGLLLLTRGQPPLQSLEVPPPKSLELKPNDHICIIGNTLADRMQHDGWLETMLHSRFPTHDFVIRNLGFSGDEVGGFTDSPDANKRMRSMSFGTADEWLAGKGPIPQPNKLITRNGVRDNRFETTNTRADVVFAFFGYNESFGGEAGLPKFKADLKSFIEHAAKQQYNGKSAPRLVLFSPIAHENLKDANLPNGSENNQRLELYTQAMDEVTREQGVVFVDLFHPTKEQYGKAAKPLTINGVHLNERGNEAVARIIDEKLFKGQLAPKRDAAALEKLRLAVADKNLYFFNRYRVLDGFNVYGDRAFIPYANRQTNYEDQQRELEIYDFKTANREKVVWALAQGKEVAVDDSNVPPPIPVATNKPGTGPNGAHVFLDGTDAIQKMTVAKNMKVTLFASEKEFPELAKPVQMQFDPQGRLWVAVWPSYPHWKPNEERDDKILIFEDTKGTGKADKMTVFADHLNCPTGFDFYNGGVLVAQAPDLWFLKDTKGTGKADYRERVISGLDSADSHHTANSFATDPGGAVYFQEGTFHHSQVETPYGPPQRVANGAVFRYEPRAQKFDVYVSHGFANPHGHVWDHWGNDFVYDGTGAQPYHGTLFSGHVEYPQKHNHPPQVYQQRTRPCPGVEMLSSRHFPEANQGNLLIGNVIGFQGILQYKMNDKDSSFGATEVEPIVSSSDANFRPSDIKIGPDGAIWFIDWHNPIIGHLQHAIRDPSRDRTHGRIYRVTYEGRDLLKPVKLVGEPLDKVLDLLKEPEDRVRSRARIELGSRDGEQVIAAANKWAAALDPKDPNYAHNLTEALWLHQSHNVVDPVLLQRVLALPDFRARAAGTRVLCYWRDRVSNSLDLLCKLAADESPRVRLEAVRAASFYTVPEAMEVALITSDHPTDLYIDFVRSETLKTLDPFVKQAIREKKQIAFRTPVGARYFLKNVATDDLLKMERSPGVYLELLFRAGVRDEFRKEALTGLAKEQKQDELRVLLDAIRSHDEQGKGEDESVAFDLVRLLTGRPAEQLAASRAELEKFATSAKHPVTRQLGFVALVAADNGVDKVWELASKSVPTLRDLVDAMPLIRDPGQRAALYPKIEPLLVGLPNNLGESAEKGKLARFVRVELPGKGTLTLAEVEVISEGRNIALQGKATQKNTAHGGDAGKAIDGNKSGKFADGGQTHTEENTDNPWWEVDLGGEFPIQSIAIYNRTDDGLGKRLDKFTVKVLDVKKNVIFQKDKQPAPELRASLDVGLEVPAVTIRHAAMNALPTVRGQEGTAFKALAQFVRDGSDRPAALKALQKIPVAFWPKEEARPLLDSLLAYIREVPVADRTTPAVLDALQTADSLTTLLPSDDARKIRKELGELGVRVLRLGTVPDQMLFDKERLVVQAGKPFEIVFENNDLMPHNLVFIQPGSLDEIGTQAEAAATQPGALERQYVPISNKVLFASRLLSPRDVQKISVTDKAPKKPGVYPYVCTYPGHSRRMNGALYVVEDLDEYLADPEVYLAKHLISPVDELLKLNRPRKEWKFDELAAEATKLSNGRSFANGKQMFTVGTCVACHKFGGVGQEFGPDLTKLDPKQQSTVEIWRDIVEPSFRINEKYQSYVIEMKDGKLYTGIILDNKGGVTKIIENPLAKAQPLVLKNVDIDSQTKSPKSMMPQGLLDKLTKEEILDLVAYVMSKGDPKHPLFQGAHDHHEHK